MTAPAGSFGQTKGRNFGATAAARLLAHEASAAGAASSAGSRPGAGSLLQAAGALLWLPQAALVAGALQSLADGGGVRTVAGPAAAVFILGALRAFLDASGSRLCFQAARADLTALRSRVANALAGRSPLDRERPASGLAASAIAEQAEAIVPYLARFQPARLRATLVPPVFLGAVFLFSWAAGLVMLLAAPLIPIFMALIGLRAKAASEAQLVELGGMNAFLLDRLRGLATIRTLDAVDLTARRLRANAESLRARTMAVLRIAFLSSAVLELFSALGVAMVAVYVGFHLLGQLEFGAWGGRLTLGRGLFILLLAPAFFEPLRDLSAVWHDRAAGEAALEALNRLSASALPLPGAEHGPGGARRGPARAVAVNLDQIGFGYAGGPQAVFDGLDLEIAPGARVALLGASGTGKSTLLALIAGLAPLSSGRIRIDGTPLTDALAAEMRTHMTWIGQKPHFFNGSLRSNITLGRADIDAAAVDGALRLAALDRKAAGALGEGASGLSGGEALRLALARAAANVNAGLILADEPTAHLDAETADAVTDGLLKLAEGRTLIVATHDPRLAARMDRFIDLEARP